MQWNREHESAPEQDQSGQYQDWEQTPPAQEPDREFTLGPAMLTGLGLGLLALCCICFLAGYVVGRRSSTSNPTAPAASSLGHSAAEILARAAQIAHPSAAGSPAPVSRTEPVAPAATLTPAAAAEEPAPPPARQQPSPQPPAQQPAAAQASAQSGVHAALPQYTAQQSGAWVVQVAAVENTQDADVLVSALRRRGYSVSARHNAGDNLIHVQVGPFTSRSDADSMRQRLLNDGYNANTEQ